MRANFAGTLSSIDNSMSWWRLSNAMGPNRCLRSRVPTIRRAEILHVRARWRVRKAIVGIDEPTQLLTP